MGSRINRFFFLIFVLKMSAFGRYGDVFFFVVLFTDENNKKTISLQEANISPIIHFRKPVCPRQCPSPW